MQFFPRPFLSFVLVIACQLLMAQEWNNSPNPDGKAITVEQLASILEQKHGVAVFYKAEWFNGAVFPEYVASLLLPEAIAMMTRGRDLDAIFLQDIILIVPAGTQQITPQIMTEQVLVIGNPNEFGRFSKASIHGRILDGTTGQPLIGAVIFAPRTSTGVSTDVSGHFLIELPVGEYRLRLSYIGYEEVFQDIRLISDGEVLFNMFSKTSQLDEVTVTARRARENILRTQMSRIEMDALMIKELPQTFGERDVVKSLTMLPGIQTIGEFGTGFNVRGGSADQNLILMENVPLFNASHLFGLISVVNPDLVNDISLMKAGIPAKYGERASSVMDIKLGSGYDQKETEISGGLGIVNSRLLLQTPIVKEKAAVYFGARSSYSDWLLRKIPDKDLMNSNAGFYDLSALSSISLNKNNLLTVFAYYSHDRFGFSDNSQHNYANTMASARWNSYLNERLSFSMIAGWSNYDYTIEEKPAYSPLTHFRLSSGVDYKTFKWNMTYLPAQNHSIEYGLNAIWYGISPGIKNAAGEESVVESLSVDREQAAEIALYVSDDFRISEQLSLDAGLRFSQYLQFGPALVYHYQQGLPQSLGSVTDSIIYKNREIVSRYNGLEPRLGIRYQLNDASSLKASYNRAKQYIHLVSNTSVMSPGDVWKLSDTYLKPLKSDHFAMGYYRNFLENTIETSVEAYYKRIYNAIEYKSGAEIAMNKAIETDLVNARGYNFGIETFVRKNSGRLTGWISYTYSESMRRTDSPHNEDQINKNAWFPSNYDRPHNLVVNMNYHISRRWRLGATFAYNTGRPVTLPESVFSFGDNFLVYYSDRNKYRLPDYHRLDVSISMGENHRLKQKGKGHWTFTIMNLYGRKNPYSVFYKKEPQTTGTGRSFNLYQMYIIGAPLPTLTYNFRI